MMITTAPIWLYILLVASVLLVSPDQVYAISNVSVTILQSAVEKGAVCLDGSPPAYYYFQGFQNGASNWIVYLQGGGWCTSIKTCQVRPLFSRAESEIPFSGLLDDDCKLNPDFCNWHKVFVHYCDGSSFQSNVEQVDPIHNLTFRGARIFHAIIDEMIAKGMGDAQNAILSGSSAGGLATILHCDTFKSLLPNVNRVKCISDSGFFIRGEGLPAIKLRDVDFAKNVTETHQLANTLPATCTSVRNPYLCLFPEYLVGNIQTPLFLIESAFDQYQVKANLLQGLYHKSEWEPCINDLSQCNTTLISLMKDFARTFKKTLLKLDYSPRRGMFVHSCFRHGHIVGFRDGWSCSSVVGNVLAHKGIGQAVGDWYFDRCFFQMIDIFNDRPLNCTSPLDDPSFYQQCLTFLH